MFASSIGGCGGGGGGGTGTAGARWAAPDARATAGTTGAARAPAAAGSGEPPASRAAPRAAEPPAARARPAPPVPRAPRERPAAAAPRAARARPAPAARAAPPPPVSKYIVVDQFGYLPDGEKIAVIRDPQTGFDASESFTPGATYALVNAATGARVFMAAPTAWNGGATDASSGDKAWWFTFTSVTTPGDYYVLDVDRERAVVPVPDRRQVYRDVLKQAVRMLFYQRAGQAKDAAHAGAGWTDAASFTGALQDQHCRLYSDKNNAATERDLRGGWYDAGDLNKYTSWTAGYVETLLRAYAENPTIWTDDYQHPRVGQRHPRRARRGEVGARLPRPHAEHRRLGAQHRGRAVGQPAVGGHRPEPVRPGEHVGDAGHRRRVRRGRAHPEAAQQRGAEHRRRRSADARAKTAWTWAVANPNVQFKNNDSASGSSGLGAGQQETDDYGRLAYKLDAAAQLFAATGDATYKTFFDASYSQLHLITYSNYVVAVGRAGAGRGARLRGRRGRDRRDGDRDPQRLPRGREEQRQPGRDHRQPRSVPRVHEGLRLGIELDQVARSATCSPPSSATAWTRRRTPT